MLQHSPVGLRSSGGRKSTVPWSGTSRRPQRPSRSGARPAVVSDALNSVVWGAVSLRRGAAKHGLVEVRSQSTHSCLQPCIHSHLEDALGAPLSDVVRPGP